MPEGYPLAGPLLALTSTLAGNLLIVGSIANLIVADAAARHGIEIGWRRHARTGLPVALVTLAARRQAPAGVAALSGAVFVLAFIAFRLTGFAACSCGRLVRS